MSKCYVKGGESIALNGRKSILQADTEKFPVYKLNIPLHDLVKNQDLILSSKCLQILELRGSKKKEFL